MIKKCLYLSAATVLASMSLACGSSEDESAEDPVVTPDGDPPPPEELACDPNAEIPCFEGFAEPCENYETAIDGDEFCRKPPERGYQLHVGPDDYDDPEQFDHYAIYPGDETSWAEIQRTPNTEVMYTGGYVSYMRPGSHHFILYSLPETDYQVGAVDGAGGANTVGALDGTWRAGATKPIQIALLEGDPSNPGGVGAEVLPEGLVALNLHFINTSDDVQLQEIWVNFLEIERDDIHTWSKPITWYGGIGMNVPPGAVQTLRNDATACVAPADVRILALTGHVHASTVRYNTLWYPSGSADPTVLFEDYNWADPTQFNYTESTEWPEPDQSTGLAGGWSGVLNVSEGDTFTWECEVHNETDVFLTFSDRVYDGEMCNVFGMYGTQDKHAPNWGCVFF